MRNIIHAIKSRRGDAPSMWQAWGEGMHVGFWRGKLGGGRLRIPRPRLENNIRLGLEETGMGKWLGFMWLRIMESCLAINQLISF
jgi:hypothetical protein